MFTRSLSSVFHFLSLLNCQRKIKLIYNELWLMDDWLLLHTCFTSYSILQSVFDGCGVDVARLSLRSLTHSNIICTWWFFVAAAAVASLHLSIKVSRQVSLVMTLTYSPYFIATHMYEHNLSVSLSWTEKSVRTSFYILLIEYVTMNIGQCRWLAAVSLNRKNNNRNIIKTSFHNWAIASTHRVQR